MDFVFWQNIISPHQSPFLHALAGKGHEVTVVAAEAMTPDRLALGWKVPDTGRCKIILAPDEGKVRQLVECSPLDAIHVLAGARWMALGRQATAWCVRNRRRLGILSEAPDPRGLGGAARWLKYTAERWTTGRHFDFLLTMGGMGLAWFQRCGYPPTRLFPFTYVTAISNQKSEVKNEFQVSAFPIRGSDSRASFPASGVTVLFVGRLVSLKGVDLLLRAFAQNFAPRSTVPAPRLALIGNGPEESALRQLADHLGIAHAIVWLGRKNHEEIWPFMAEADVFVLPSRKDGWGAVVNEALMAGTPVICSTACGAAELLGEPWRGEVFSAGSVSALAAALQRRIKAGYLTPQSREQIQTWAAAIGGEAVADYFLRLMRHVYERGERPEPPWRGALGEMKSKYQEGRK